MSPGVAKKKLYVASPSTSRPSFESALQKVLRSWKLGARRSSPDCRKAPVFQGGYQ